ncbi:MAG: hypothetical protein L0228_09630 [Planctomycetes bacterium]|nr:hypothetical protein [Planctomycetota bacterium]
METLFHRRLTGIGGRADLLFVLTHYVRCLSLAQIAAGLPGARDSMRAARECVRRLTCDRLVESWTAMVPRPLQLSGPILRSGRDSEPPDFGAIAYRVASRWNRAPERTVVVRATPRAARVTGGPLPARRSERDTELAHDLTLSQIFLEHYLGNAHVTWIPEDALVAEGWPRRDRNVPDAVIRSATGDTALELAGRSYSARRLSQIHLAFRDMSYELW